jgi:hypothetical protein
MKNRSNNIKRLQPEVRSICLKTAKGSAELEQFKPQDPYNFEIGLEVFVGIERNSEGSERFDITVCTSKWILENLKESDHMIGHGMLIVSKYSYDRIVEHIKSYVKMCAGNTIDDVMRRVGLLGEWESEWEIKLE